MGNEAFRATLGKWANHSVPEFMLGVARIAIQDTAELTIDLTPVDTGFLVANWQPGLNAPVLSEVDAYGNGYAASKEAMVVTEIKLGDTFYYTNNAVYARRINYGFVGADSLGRHYNQRGAHMIEQATAAWETNVEKAAAEMLAGGAP